MSEAPINITALRTTSITSLNYIISTRKLLSKFGYRLQYSVFKIENSERILNIVSSEIENRFAKKFTQSDSVYIFRMSSSCEVTKYGYSKNEDSDIIFIK